jgi:hypothetical protein
MEIFYLILAGLLVLGSPGFLSPNSKFELGLTETPPPGCVEAKPGAIANDRPATVGKASDWSLSGRYHCQRTLFTYGDRDSFYEFVAKESPLQLQRITQAAAQLPNANTRLWHVEVFGDDPKIIALVRHLARNELALAIGSGAVAWGLAPQQSVGEPLAKDAGFVLDILVRRVTSPELIISAKARSQAPSGIQTWAL